MFFLALVFQTMTLRVERKNKMKRKHKNQGQTTLEWVRAQCISQITNYMMHVMNAHMVHALMHKNLFNLSKFANN